MFTYLSFCLSVLSIYLSICLSIYLSICKFENEAILRDFLNFWTWQHQNKAILRDVLKFCTGQRQKRSYSSRLPQFSKLTAAKMKQFCETSFKNGKLSAELTASYQCLLIFFFRTTYLTYCACHEKLVPGHTKFCTYHAKSSQQSWRSDAPKCNPSGNQRPPNISDEHVSCTAPATQNASLQIVCKCPTPTIVFGNATQPSRFGGAESLAPATQNHIWTSKSGPSMWCS